MSASGFDLRTLTDTPVYAEHSGTNAQQLHQQQLHEHLSKLFQLAKLSEDEQAVLRLLAVLPYQYYQGKAELLVWLGLDKPSTIPTAVTGTLGKPDVGMVLGKPAVLVNLAKKGWLQRDGQQFALHPVIGHVAGQQVPLDSKSLGEFAMRFAVAIQPGVTEHWITRARSLSENSDRSEGKPV